jgi:preprotein translocase subunit SecB
MTDNQQNAANSGQGQQNAMTLLVNAQYVKDLSFESPHAPQIFAEPPSTDPAKEPRVDISVNVGSQQLADNVFEVVLRLKTESKTGERSTFICELAYAGVFTLGGKLPEPQLRQTLMVECPRLLFPFARAIIADAVREGGFPPLLLLPIDFAEMLRQNEMAQMRPAANA